MLKRYILINYLSLYLLVFLATSVIIYTYLLGELLFLFKHKNLWIFIEYSLSFLVSSFFYAGSFTGGLALVLLIRKLSQKRLDLLVKSFGISYYQMLSYVIVFFALVSFLNLFLSYSFYPAVQRKLYQIEREFKKAKELEGGIVRNLWLVENKEGTTYYNFELIDTSSGLVSGFSMIRVEEQTFREVVSAQKGYWEGNTLLLPSARVIDLEYGQERLTDYRINLLELSQIKPLAVKPEHMDMKSLIFLSSIGKELGINQRRYILELAKRLFTSVLPVNTILFVAGVFAYKRVLAYSVYALVFYTALHWGLINTIKSLLENTSYNPYLLLALYLPALLLPLKGLYYLSKG